MRQLFETYGAYPQGEPRYSKDDCTPRTYVRIPHEYPYVDTSVRWSSTFLESYLEDERQAHATYVPHSTRYALAQRKRRRGNDS